MTIRRMVLFAPLVALSVLAASAGEATLTADESAELVGLLEDTRAELIAKTKPLSDEQWSYKPGPDRWSVGEIVEHLMLAEAGNLAAVEQMAKKQDDWAEKTKGKDAMLDKMLPEYYELRGWTEDGQITNETMARLGL